MIIYSLTSAMKITKRDSSFWTVAAPWAYYITYSLLYIILSTNQSWNNFKNKNLLVRPNHQEYSNSIKEGDQRKEVNNQTLYNQRINGKQ